MLNWFQLGFDVITKLHFHMVGVDIWVLDLSVLEKRFSVWIVCTGMIHAWDCVVSLRISFAEGGWPEIF